MNTQKIISLIRDCYATKEFIPLHAPTFCGKEEDYVLNTLHSTYVSSVGTYVTQFENQIIDFTKAKHAIATVNGTAALHTALYAVGVRKDDLVITQALTFVATCNALYHMGAEPIFIDVSMESLGLCPAAVQEWLEENAFIDDDQVCRYKKTQQKIAAIVPMHTFGHPVQLDELTSLSESWHIPLVEDAAESLGSFYKGIHTGTLGVTAALSFNGNKIITTGGGGMVICNDDSLGKWIKHITTTAKKPHTYEFYHDEAGFNYRLPNLNAALGCAQMEQLNHFLNLKRTLASTYQSFFQSSPYRFVTEPEYAKSNYWLNALLCESKEQRDLVLTETNDNGVMTRPVWTLMHKLPPYASSIRGSLKNSQFLEERLINLPSSPTPHVLEH